MSAIIKPRVGANSDHTAIESNEVISVTMPVITPVAANSDWFEGMVPELFDIPEHDTQPWVDKTSGIADTWSRVEDLWLRLARHPGVACTTVSDPIQGDQLLMFRIQGARGDDEGELLLESAGCSSTYQWREEGSLGSLVSNMVWYGDTLVIDLTPFQKIRAWPDGGSLVWQLQALLRRLREMGKTE